MLTPKFLFTLLLLFLSIPIIAQEAIVINQDQLFDNQDLLEVSMEYSIKELRKNTKDSAWTNVQLSYMDSQGTIDSLEIRLKTRGNFRLNHCYFPPVKVKIKKAKAKGTIFKGHKELKLVIPCKKEKQGNDSVIREYLVYKMFESISPYHFRTRLLKIHFTEIKNKKTQVYDFYGFFIEDVNKMAKRSGGDVVKRYVHPLGQEPASSARSELFQYMVGNVDFSSGHQHNGKLIFKEKKVITVPYDFDMSGFVDPSYGELPTIDGKPIELTTLKERLYRGFVRDEIVMQNARDEFIENKEEFFNIIENHSSYFQSEKQLKDVQKYITGFYKIIEDDKRFDREIIKQARMN